MRLLRHRNPARTITLDHVRPRRGQTAYDRPDNLVLACRECNAAKADTPFVAFLMASGARGVFLLHYGDHLSEPLKEIARQASERPMLREGPVGQAERRPAGKQRAIPTGIALCRDPPAALRLSARPDASATIRFCSAACAAGYPSAGLARSGRPHSAA